MGSVGAALGAPDMSWFLYALAAAILISLVAVTEKKILQHEHSLIFSAVNSIIILLLSVPLLFFANFSTLTTETLILIYICTLIAAIAFWLTAHGVKHLELSVASPLMVLNLVFVPFLAFIFVGEKLSTTQIAGVLLILIGVLALELIVHHGKLLPIIPTKGKESIFAIMFIAGLMYAATSIFDKHLLKTLDPITYLVIAHFFIAINTVALSLLFDKTLKQDLKLLFAQDLKTTLLNSILLLAERLCLTFAIATTSVSVAIAIKRLSIIFSTLLAGKLFHEKNIGQKVAVCIMMLAGVVLLVWQA